jgi:hypothetical protein
LPPSITGTRSYRRDRDILLHDVVLYDLERTSTKMEILIGVIIGLVAAGGILFVGVLAKRWIERRLSAVEAEQKRFFERLDADMRQFEENMLAKKNEQPQNVVQPSPQATSTSDEPPFWKNKRALEEAKAQFETQGFDGIANIPELGGALPHEIWRKLDEAALNLEDVDEPN